MPTSSSSTPTWASATSPPCWRSSTAWAWPTWPTRAPEEWTDAAFEHCVTTHEPSGVRVLTWGSDPADSENVGVDLLLAALRWAKAHHSYVVVDTHPGYDDRTMAMLTLANEILLVVTPEVGALRNSAQFLGLAREVGLGDIIRVVVNRANHGIRLPDIEDVAQAAGQRHGRLERAEGHHRLERGAAGASRSSRKEKISTDLHNVARDRGPGQRARGHRPAAALVAGPARLPHLERLIPLRARR